MIENSHFAVTFSIVQPSAVAVLRTSIPQRALVTVRFASVMTLTAPVTAVMPYDVPVAVVPRTVMSRSVLPDPPGWRVNTVADWTVVASAPAPWIVTRLLIVAPAYVPAPTSITSSTAAASTAAWIVV